MTINLAPAEQDTRRIVAAIRDINSTLSAMLTPIATVALPPATASLDGSRGFVTDANATTFASIVAGGGTNHVPVYCDGATPAWRIG